MRPGSCFVAVNLQQSPWGAAQPASSPSLLGAAKGEDGVHGFLPGAHWSFKRPLPPVALFFSHSDYFGSAWLLAGTPGGRHFLWKWQQPRAIRERCSMTWSSSPQPYLEFGTPLDPTWTLWRSRRRTVVERPADSDLFMPETARATRDWHAFSARLTSPCWC